MENMEIVLIANIQLMTRSTSIEQVHLKAFFVSSVEFCKQVKFDDKDKKTIEITYNYFI